MKAFFRNANQEQATPFNCSRGLLTISVGQETHEEEFFEQTVELINQNFKSCVILVDDTLQRHTMSLYSDKTMMELYEISLENGDLWLLRNERYLKRFTIPYKIIRWDMWLKHKRFILQKNIIENLINNNKDYREAFYSSIDTFYEKYSKRIKNIQTLDPAIAKLTIYNYLLEECIALSLWPELNCQHKIYTSTSNLAMRKTHEMLVLPEYPLSLHEATIGFRNARQIRPQNFIMDRN